MNNTYPQSSLLIYMLEDARKVTLDGVKHLTKEQMFVPPIPGEYPIGSYLMHLAECDIGWYETMTGEKVPDELKRRCYYAKWYDPDPNYHPDYTAPKEPLDLNVYFDVIAETRNLFLDKFRIVSDEELDREYDALGYNGKVRRISKKWVAYNMLQHECHTRGQMFLLIRMAGWKEGKG